MQVRNRDVADMLTEVADLLEIRDANAFRVRSYRSAARTVENLSEEVADLVEQDQDLTELPDIGESIAAKIEEIAKTGKLRQLDKLTRKMGKNVSELLEIRNLGPKGARRLYSELGITKPSGVVKAAKEGRIAELSGFGEKTQNQLLNAAQKYLERGAEGRISIGDADEIVEPLIEHLRQAEAITRVVAAGSYRRRKETIGDLDIVAVSDDVEAAMDTFAEYDRVRKVESRGSTRSTVVLQSGLHVDFRVVEAGSFGAALYYFTGSKEHSIAVRRIAQDRGLKINEYGVFDGDERIAGETEKSVFQSIGLAVVPPELREDRGEVAAAKNGSLPELVELDDVRGDLHMHSTATDGKNSIREMAQAARELGYDYVAITDHSKRVTMAGGLDADRLREQMDEIDSLNEELDGIKVLKGIEVDILRDADLDLPDSLLEELDVVVAAVHYNRGMSEQSTTDRIVKAIRNHPVSILAHPTGRLIGSRDPARFDSDAVFGAAADSGVAMEVNANPERLDLNDRLTRSAVEARVPLVISTDAHSTGQLQLMRYGIDTARRGWVEARNVINTRTLSRLRSALKPGG